MSAALGGMIIGALVSGPTADRFGRKIVLSVSMLIFGGFTLASAYATDLNTLVVLRFLTGIGLGAAMPNATTLFSEYCPQRSRSLLVTCMFCGYNLGMATGGFISSWLIPTFGWHSLFLLGGWSPLILMILVIFFLPESYRFLIVKGRDREKVRKILMRIAPNAKYRVSLSFMYLKKKLKVQRRKVCLACCSLRNMSKVRFYCG